MPKLYVIGDSFTAPPKQPDPQVVWPMMVAEQLGCELVNASMIGTSQDWAWLQIQQWMKIITPEDYLIVALTHPSRVWFFEDKPRLTHNNIIDFDNYCSKEEAKAAEMYIRYIQRPSIDLIQINNRMAYLAYHVKSKGLRRPLMIKCFSQDVAEGEHMPELNWAKGILLDNAQRDEFDPPELDDNITGFWHGVDPRYNHLCLSNHPIMAGKVAAALKNDSTLDLTTGFIKGILTAGCLDDDELCKKEVNMEVVLYNRKKRDAGPRTLIPWKKRTNLTHTF